MSTPEQPATPALTRKQMRDIRNTGSTPIVTGDGRSAWVRVSDMLPVSRHKTCFVQRTREGNLRWTKSNAIQ